MLYVASMYRIVGLLISMFTIALRISCSEPITRVVLNHKVIGLLDGTPRADVLKMRKLEKGIKELREGDKLAKGLISHNGKKYTLRELTALEKAFKKQNPDAHSECVRLFEDALDDAIKQFDLLVHPYLKEVQEYPVAKISLKQMYCALLEDWAEKRKLNTLLTKFGRYGIDNAVVLLKKLAPSLVKFDELLSHLILFLQDFRVSSKKSLKNLVDSLPPESKDDSKPSPKDEL